MGAPICEAGCSLGGIVTELGKGNDGDSKQYKPGAAVVTAGYQYLFFSVTEILMHACYSN